MMMVIRGYNSGSPSLFVVVVVTRAHEVVYDGRGELDIGGCFIRTHTRGAWYRGHRSPGYATLNSSPLLSNNIAIPTECRFSWG